MLYFLFLTRFWWNNPTAANILRWREHLAVGIEKIRTLSSDLYYVQASCEQIGNELGFFIYFGHICNQVPLGGKVTETRYTKFGYFKVDVLLKLFAENLDSTVELRFFIFFLNFCQIVEYLASIFDDSIPFFWTHQWDDCFQLCWLFY